MKKSQLKNIIRESIKEVLIEQENRGLLDLTSQLPQDLEPAGPTIPQQPSGLPGFTCWDNNCMDCANPQYANYCSQSISYSGQPQMWGHMTHWNNINGCLKNCGDPDTTCRKCNHGPFTGVHAFNVNSWANTWTNNNAFNSANPNQPCTHICNKKLQWTNQCANVGRLARNILACKLSEAQNQINIHGCNC